MNKEYAENPYHRMLFGHKKKLHIKRWMNPENITQSDISQSQESPLLNDAVYMESPD